MASILPFLLLLLPLLPPSLSTQPQPQPHSDLVEKTCTSTTYPDFCVSSLSSSPQTPKATSTKTLSTIIISLAVSNATNTSSFASSLAKNSNTNPSLAVLLRACADKYARAREALQASAEAVKEEEYDYAFLHVSAAAEYPNVCRRGMGTAYPAEMGRREEVLERLCAVALDIIDSLITTT